MVQEYCRGDIFFITEGTYTGSEQSGGRPGVIVSNDLGNKTLAQCRGCIPHLTRKEAHADPCRGASKSSSTALCEKHSGRSQKSGWTLSSAPALRAKLKNIDHALLCSPGLHAPAAVGEVPSHEAEAPDRIRN